MKKILLLILIGCFLTGTFYSGNVLQQKYQSREDISVSSLENMPPWIAFSSVALGGFKSLLVNTLWVRIFDLQENDRYFELLQMSDWLTDLQPDMTNTWKFQVWNISYNVLARFTKPKDRYRWLKQGIRLLRDKAIFYNPKNVELYNELALLYELKMSLDHDVYHLSYKKLWAIDMIRLFGGAVIDFDKYLSLPTNLIEVTSKPENMKLLSQLEDVDFNFPQDFESLLFEGKPLTTKQLSVIRNYYDAFMELSHFLRREKIQNEYKLDIAFMQSLEQKHGNLDWRLPYAHAVYWSSQAVKIADRESDTPFYYGERALYQSLSLGIFNGYFEMWEDGSVFILPNFDLIMPLKDHFIAVGEKCGFDFIKAPFRYFLEDSVVMLYLKGDKAESLMLYEDLRSRFGGYKQDILKFVITKMMAEAGIKNKDEFMHYLMRKYVWWSVISDKAEDKKALSAYANGFAKMARQIAVITGNDIAEVKRAAVNSYKTSGYGAKFVEKANQI